MPAYSTVERAFQIARGGECQTIDALRALLTREGYGDAVAQTSYPLVRKRLNDAMQGRPAVDAVKLGRRRKRGVLKLNYGQS